MKDTNNSNTAKCDGNEENRDRAVIFGNEISSSISLCKSMQVLDFGAGSGALTSQLIDKVKKITALDISSAVLKELNEREELKGKVETICQNILATPLNRTFDLIISSMAIHHIKSLGILFKRFSDNLKPGGKIALIDLDKEDGSFHGDGKEGIAHFGFDREKLNSCLKDAGFTDIQFKSIHNLNRNGKEFPVFLVVANKIHH
jgi:putative AdoMet-dependent methyltransferase